MEERKFRLLDIIFLLVIVPVAIYVLYGFFNPPPRPVNHNYFTYNINGQDNFTYNINGQDNLTVVAENSIGGTVVVKVSNDNLASYVMGSGFMCFYGGYIATNYHVIEEAAESSAYKVYISHYGMSGTSAGSHHIAQVLWFDANLDVAVLHCGCDGLNDSDDAYTVIPMNDRTVFAADEDKLRLLESVITIGAPLSFDFRDTVTAGEVSGFNRVSYDGYNVYEQLIQITAPINHGNSGGPLIDRNGDVIGLNTAGFVYDQYGDPVNSMFFAVPITPIVLVIEKVVAEWENGKNLYQTSNMGVSVYDKETINYSATSKTFNKDGVLVTSVSGAATGKLQVNDIITGIKIDQTEYEIKLRNDYIYALLRAEAGDKIEVIFTRGATENKRVEIWLQ